MGVCATILLGVHVFKILLGDSNRNNFLVSAGGGRARICDFASGKLDADDIVLKQEEDGLLTCLESDEFTMRRTVCGTHMGSTALQMYYPTLSTEHTLECVEVASLMTEPFQIQCFGAVANRDPERIRDDEESEVFEW